MRIEKIHVKGFGILDEHDFSPFSPNLTLLIGKNEAGKTTLLEFIRRILFGFPKKSSNVNPYDPRSGDTKGGDLSFVLKDGKGFKVTRLKGSKISHEGILFQDGSTQPISALPPLLGKISKDFFNRIFAITNSDLHQYGTLANDLEIKGYLIGGATGLGLDNPIKIKREIREKADKIFIPGGSKRLINQISNELNDINSQIREIQNNTDAYLAQKENLTQLIEKRETLEEYEKSQQKENRQLDLIKRGLKDWNNIYLKRNKLEELPQILNLSQESISHVEKISDDINNIQNKIADIEDEIAIKQSKIKSNPVNQGFIENEQEILALIRQIPKYQLDKDEIIKISTSIIDKQKNLKKLLLDVGPEWDEEKVMKCNLSHTALDNILKTSENYYQTKSECETLRSKWELIENNINLLNQDVQEINSPLLENRKNIQVLSNRISEYQQNIFETKKLKKKCEALYGDQLSSNGKIKSKWPDLDLNILPDYDFEKLQNASLQSLSQIEKNENKIEEIIRSIQEKKVSYESWNLKLSRQKEKIQELGHIPSHKDLENYDNTLKKLKQLIQEKQSEDKMKNVVSGWIVEPIYAGLSGIFGVILVIFGILISFTPIIYAGIALISFGGLWYLLISQLKPPSDKKVTPENLVFEIEKYSKRLKFSKIPTIDEINKKEKDIQKNYQKIKLYQIYIEELQEIELELNQAKKVSQLVDEELEKTKDKLNEYLKSVENWRLKNSIPSTVQLNDIPHFITTIVEYKRISNEIIKIKEDIKEKSISSSQFLSDTSEFFKSKFDNHNDIVLDPNQEPDLIIARILELKDGSDNEYIKDQRNKSTKNKILIREKEKSDLEHLLEKSEENNRGILQQFHELLEKYGFDSKANPTQIHLQYKRILNARDTYDTILSDIEKEKLLSLNNSQYEEKIKNLAFLLPDLNQGTPPESFVALLESHLNEQKERLRIYRENNDDIQSKNERVIQLEKKKSDLLPNLEKVLKKTGFSTLEEIVEIKPSFFEQLKIQSEIEQHEQNIFTIAGNEERYIYLKEELQKANPDEIDDRIDQTSQSLIQIRKDLDAIIQEIAILQNNCESLKKSEEQNRLLIKKSQLKAELKTLAEEWAVYSLADSILHEALEKYERERQPAVVNRAEKIFGQMTGGGYTRLYMPVSNEEFEMEMEDGFIKTPSLLSQGTAEQLYTSLRLAYAEEYCSQAEPLPIILDDILVNCDANRMKAAVHAIVELSKEVQVIYCTCHEPLIQCFRDAAPDMGVIEI
jgi:uncharacterized protein YhaN